MFIAMRDSLRIAHVCFYAVQLNNIVLWHFKLHSHMFDAVSFLYSGCRVGSAEDARALCVGSIDWMPVHLNSFLQRLSTLFWRNLLAYHSIENVTFYHTKRPVSYTLRPHWIGYEFKLASSINSAMWQNSCIYRQLPDKSFYRIMTNDSLGSSKSNNPVALPSNVEGNAGSWS